MATRRDDGADFWATPDRRLAKGGPFSTIEAPALLVELGVDPAEDVLCRAAELLLSMWREDGRFRPTPSGAIYPCHSINAGGVILVFERRVLNWLRPP